MPGTSGTYENKEIGIDLADALLVGTLGATFVPDEASAQIVQVRAGNLPAKVVALVLIGQMNIPHFSTPVNTSVVALLRLPDAALLHAHIERLIASLDDERREAYETMLADSREYVRPAQTQSRVATEEEAARLSQARTALIDSLSKPASTQSDGDRGTGGYL